MTPKAAHVTQLRLMALDPVHIKKGSMDQGKRLFQLFPKLKG